MKSRIPESWIWVIIIGFGRMAGLVRALIGPWGSPYTRLFSLLTLTVE